MSGCRQSFNNRRSILTVPLYRTPQTRAFEENPALLPGRSEANLTMIQIKQQERSYFRRLNGRNNSFTGYRYLARRAYHSIRPAVKTGRPHDN